MNQHYPSPSLTEESKTAETSTVQRSIVPGSKVNGSLVRRSAPAHNAGGIVAMTAIAPTPQSVSLAPIPDRAERDAMDAIARKLRKKRLKPQPAVAQLQSLVLTIRARPLMVICCGWLFFVMLAGLSLNALMNPRAVRETAQVVPPAQVQRVHTDGNPTDISTMVPSEPVPPSDSGTLPLWLLGAIALSCAAGSFALSYPFKPSRRPTLQPVASSAHRTRVAELAQMAATATEKAEAQAGVVIPVTTVQRLQAIAKPESAVRPHSALATTASIPPHALPPALKRKRLKLNASTAPVVTLAPEHKPTSVEVNEPSLVELMDLRTQHPLHHWTDQATTIRPIGVKHSRSRSVRKAI